MRENIQEKSSQMSDFFNQKLSKYTKKMHILGAKVQNFSGGGPPDPPLIGRLCLLFASWQKILRRTLQYNNKFNVLPTLNFLLSWQNSSWQNCKTDRLTPAHINHGCTDTDTLIHHARTYPPWMHRHRHTHPPRTHISTMDAQTQTHSSTTHAHIHHGCTDTDTLIHHMRTHPP